MSNVDPKRGAVFVGVFSVVAILIYGSWLASHGMPGGTPGRNGAMPMAPQQIEEDRNRREREAVEQKAAAEAKAAHAQYVERYVNASMVPRAGGFTLAVVAASEDGKLNPVIASALATHFKSPPFMAMATLFKPAFVTDGLFAEVFGGSTDVFAKLDLANSLAAAILARESVRYSTDPSLENLVSATMQLEVVAIPVSGTTQNQGWTFTASGAGFNQMAAHAMAQERLLQQIANDSKMSISRN